jgi:hypothetical protein
VASASLACIGWQWHASSMQRTAVGSTYVRTHVHIGWLAGCLPASRGTLVRTARLRVLSCQFQMAKFPGSCEVRTPASCVGGELNNHIYVPAFNVR